MGKNPMSEQGKFFWGGVRNMRTGWMQRDCWHGMHVRLCNVLDDDGDIEIPCSNRLVVGSGHESAILVHKGDRIDRSQMLVIFLRYLTGIDVVL